MSHRRRPCRITRRNIEHHSRSSRRAHNRTRSSNDTRQPLTFPEQCFQLPCRHTTARRPALRDVPTFTTSRRVGPRGASPRLSATWRSVRRPFCSQTSLVVPIMIHMCVRERKRRYYIRASHFTPISGRGRFCPTCAGPPPSVVRSTRPDFEHHLGLQLATSSCMVSRSTWTTRATKPRHLQLADLRRIRIIRPTAPRNPAFGRVEGENGLAESPKRASEMSEGAIGHCPTQNTPPSMRGHCGHCPPRELDAPGGGNAAPTDCPHGSASCR